MTVADDTTTTDRTEGTEVDDRPSPPRRRADRTGVADRPRENRSPAAQRAIDRRRKRAAQRSTATIAGRRGADVGLLGRIGSPGELVRRVPFVVLVIGILSVGLGLTLWLSTTAAEDSYQLSVARKHNQDLMIHRDALKNTFESKNSAPEIGAAATKLGMIPAKDVARYVIDANGKGRIVGEITAATGTAGPSLGSESSSSTAVPQPGSSSTGNTAQGPVSQNPVSQNPASQNPVSQTAPGADLSAGGGTGSLTSIASNVLPQSANAPTSTPVAPRASAPPQAR